jgi:hypothetical protein
MTSKDAPVAIAGAVGLVALAVAARSHRRGATDAGRAQQPDPRAALAAYFHDHLTGADAATQVVQQLERACAGTPQGRLFESLHQRFLRERRVVEGLLSDLGESHGWAKRAAGRAAGKALRAMGGGATDDLSLFQALEGLAVGVQGKRCMWRALQRVRPPLRAPLEALEADAVSQWEQIEASRLAIVPTVFSMR